jgi:beta-lactamase regulating signal transducer with metallopeptidase domain
MSLSPLPALMAITAVSSAAIVLVALLRIPMRYGAGARAGYCLWILVPATAFAALLPGLPLGVGPALPSGGSAGVSIAMHVVEVRATGGYAAPLLTCWLFGALLMLVVQVRRQLTFVRSLGRLTRGPDDIYRSNFIGAPMVVGAWPARVVIPGDFESRYGAEEQVLMLAHERAHLFRGDAHVNAIAAGWQCLFWFNPLVHWAVGQLRFDQELSCDAVVVAQSEIGRRRYADALLKTQLADDAERRVPLGCHWQSTHPLKERIAMLKYPSPTNTRRLCGIGFSLALAAFGSYSVWAAQPDSPSVNGMKTPIAINMKWSINGTDALKVGSTSSSYDFVVDAGREFVRKTSVASGASYETRCVASLPNTGTPSPTWESVKASGKSIAGMILLECRLSNDEKTFSTPAIAMREGKAGSIAVTSEDGSVSSRLEFRASTLPAGQR